MSYLDLIRHWLDSHPIGPVVVALLVYVALIAMASAERGKA